MNLKKTAVTGAGVITALLGLMWFLQGAGILLLCPVLCFADCGCITGGSPFWEATGAIAFVMGIVIVGVGIGRNRT